MNFSMRKLCRVGSSVAVTALISVCFYLLYSNANVVISAFDKAVTWFFYTMSDTTWWLLGASIPISLVIFIYYLAVTTDLEEFTVLINISYLGVFMFYTMYSFEVKGFWTMIVPSLMLILLLLLYHSPWFKFCNRFRG